MPTNNLLVENFAGLCWRIYDGKAKTSQCQAGLCHLTMVGDPFALKWMFIRQKHLRACDLIGIGRMNQVFIAGLN